MPALRSIGRTPKPRAVDGSAGAMIVPSRMPMNIASATTSATARGRGAPATEAAMRYGAGAGGIIALSPCG